jgi:hypothetical protein
MTGQEISLFDAWSAWAHGVDIKQRVLWGLEIYWWARWAKVAAFIAGLVILLDIIGINRLERWFQGKQDALKAGRDGLGKRVTDRLDYLLSESRGRGWVKRVTLRLEKAGLVWLCLSIVMTFWLWVALVEFSESGPLETILSILGIPAIFVGSLLLTHMALRFIAAAVGAVADGAVTIILWTLKALAKQGLAAITVRSTSLALLMGAFHFDFLAS